MDINRPEQPCVPGQNVCIIFFWSNFLLFFSNLAEETTTQPVITIPLGPDFPTASSKYPWEQ